MVRPLQTIQMLSNLLPDSCFIYYIYVVLCNNLKNTNIFYFFSTFLDRPRPSCQFFEPHFEELIIIFKIKQPHLCEVQSELQKYERLHSTRLLNDDNVILFEYHTYNGYKTRNISVLLRF